MGDLRGRARPTRRADWITLGLTGTLFLASGNGLVVWGLSSGRSSGSNGRGRR